VPPISRRVRCCPTKLVACPLKISPHASSMILCQIDAERLVIGLVEEVGLARSD
jgi:hypothetical protein